MRVSVDKADPGYRVDAYQFQAFLDGQEISTRCVTADEDVGEVVVFVLDEQGNLQVNEQRDAVVKETLRGKVEIRRREGSING